MRKLAQVIRNDGPATLAGPFGGLTDKELKALYSLARIIRLNEGDILIREGDTDQTVYVILGGALEIVKDLEGKGQPIAVLRKDDWVGEIAFTKKVARTASAVAREPSKVMAIDTVTLEALEEKTQLFLFRRLHDLASNRIQELTTRVEQLSSKNRQLADSFYRARHRSSTHYAESDLLKKIIQKVPRLPAFASTLATKLLSGRASYNEIARLISEDPSIVAHVLQRVNSPYYGFKQRISDIHRASVLLGLGELYQLVVTDAVRQTMPDSPKFQKLHAHSVAISRLGFLLSQASHIGVPVEMSTIGVLHELGETVIELLRRQNPHLEMLIDTLDQTQLGSLLFKQWGLPEVIPRTVEFHPYPEFVPPERIPEDVRGYVALLYTAHLCCSLMEGRPEEDLPTTFLPEYLDLFGWQNLSLGDILRVHLLPGLTQRMEACPIVIRELVTRYKDAQDSDKEDPDKSQRTPAPR